MQPEIIVQLIQFGAMGLLAFVIYVGKTVMDYHLTTLRTLIEGNMRLQEKMIDALLVLRSELVNSAKQDFSHERSGASQSEKSIY